MTDPASRPEIAPAHLNMGQYYNILVGFPVWWYVEPRIADTFLERYDFTGKTLILFAASGGSGIEKAEKHWKVICPTANWKLLFDTVSEFGYNAFEKTMASALHYSSDRRRHSYAKRFGRIDKCA